MQNRTPTLIALTRIFVSLVLAIPNDETNTPITAPANTIMLATLVDIMLK